MSYDPYGYQAEEPRPGDPYEEYEWRLPGDAARIKGRVQAPAICLIVVAVLNALAMFVQVAGTIRGALQSPQDIEKDQQMMRKFLPPEMQEEMEKEQQKQSPESEKLQAVIINTVLSLLMVVSALLTLLGGIRMLSLKSYALCIVGSISAAIPCISCGGCCGFGEAVGIWALVVLINPDVKSAFR